MIFALSLFMAICSNTLVGICLGESQFITWDDLGVENFSGNLASERSIGGVLFVKKDGSGSSRTVQGAINMVPDGNTRRVKIFISPGVYRERVVVPSRKPYISFIGNANSETVISWYLRASDRNSEGHTIGTYYSASVAVESDYFCAHGITFENSQNTASGAKPGAEGMQAVALRLSGDKAVIHKCRIVGFQDTLFDHIGRHYFLKSYIEGSIDFIFGSARSLYQGCTLHAVAATYGAVAASQRNSASEDSGFSFLKCKLTGTGMIYLGRAWGRYARVVYALCHIKGIIIPQGWSDWGDPSRRSTVLFGEFNCTGSGAQSRGRVPWARSLTYEEARPFLNPHYIDGSQWLQL